ncbi:TPA: hypothetical protein P0E18_004525 [Vibrio harveyi]|nr:hypothetical protein [Vibrio harveyi]
MSNILICLRDNLQKCTNQNITAADLADVLGYGSTQIKSYLRDINKGTLTKSNHRLERAAFFAHELGSVNGFDSLLPLMKKFDPDENGDGAWMDRARRKVGAFIENQIDIDDVLESETDDKTSVFLGLLSDSDVICCDLNESQIGEIAERMFLIKPDLHISMLGEYVNLIEAHDQICKLTNRRLLKRYMEDNASGIFSFPDYVPLSMREELANHDPKELEEAFATGGKTCTMRILKGYLKQ